MTVIMEYIWPSPCAYKATFPFLGLTCVCPVQ